MELETAGESKANIVANASRWAPQGEKRGSPEGWGGERPRQTHAGEEGRMEMEARMPLGARRKQSRAWLRVPGRGLREAPCNHAHPAVAQHTRIKCLGCFGGKQIVEGGTGGGRKGE